MQSAGRAALLLFAVLLALSAATSPLRVWLPDVENLTVRVGDMATGRRTSVPALECVGTGPANDPTYHPTMIRCTNIGHHGADVTWDCTADTHTDVELATTNVICEGYNDADDAYVTAGSCSVEYTLQYRPEESYTWTYLAIVVAGAGIFWLAYAAMTEDSTDISSEETTKPTPPIAVRRKGPPPLFPPSPKQEPRKRSHYQKQEDERNRQSAIEREARLQRRVLQRQEQVERQEKVVREQAERFQRREEQLERHREIMAKEDLARTQDEVVDPYSRRFIPRQGTTGKSFLLDVARAGLLQPETKAKDVAVIAPTKRREEGKKESSTTIAPTKKRREDDATKAPSSVIAATTQRREAGDASNKPSAVVATTTRRREVVVTESSTVVTSTPTKKRPDNKSPTKSSTVRTGTKRR